MIKITGNNITIADLISCKVTNLKNLIIFSKRKNYEIKLVISNKRNAKGLIFAKQHKIPTKIYYFKKSSRDKKKK